jgi:ParB family chromosome partitioning protein
MAKKVASLGKGLEALLPSAFSIEPPSPDSLKVDDGKAVGVTAMVALNKISPNPMQPREDFDPIALEDLKKSIREKGVIQPITIRRVPEGRYEIIAGERRFRASTEIGLETIPAYILDIETDAEMLELALIENVQRENLNPIEVALGYKRLMEECALTQEEVSKKVGKDRTTVTNFLRLLKLPREIQVSLRQKILTMGHARAILSLSDEAQQREVFRQVRDSELSVRRTEELVKKIEAGLSVGEAVLEAVEKKNAIATGKFVNGAQSSYNPTNPASSVSVPHSRPPQPAITTEGFAIPDDLKGEFHPISPEAASDDAHGTTPTNAVNGAETAEINAIENKLRHILATQVRVKLRANGSGSVEIEFYSHDELERLQELFSIIEREQYS